MNYDTFLRGLHPDDRDRVHGLVQDSLTSESGGLYRTEYRTIGIEDKQERWLSSVGRAFFDEKGRPVRFIGATLDITDRKSSDRALKESEAQFRAFFENSAVGASQIDMEGRFVQVNDRFCQITGYLREELIGRMLLDLSHPSDREVHEAYLKKFFSGRLPIYRIEKRYIRKDGGEIWVRVVSGLVRDSEGRPWRSAAITEDITERKQAEDALRESEKRFRLVLDSSQIGWWHWDFTRGVLEGDTMVNTLLGLAPDASLTFDLVVEQAHPEDRERLKERAMQLQQREGDYEIDFRACGQGSDYRWLHATGRSFSDGGTKALYAMGTIFDISQQKRLEGELRAAILSAEQANAAKDQFLAVLSHELRTPLTPILAAVQLMLRSDDLSERAKGHLQIIRRNLELEARLIDDLLDLTRIVRGKILLEKVPVDICEILEQVAQVCLPDIEARRLQFAVEVKDGPVSIHADTSRLQQVFWNLVKNSVKFTHEGGHIAIFASRSDEHAIVEVRDSGIGIEPHLLPRIFDAFEQGGPQVTRQFGGLGLGLAITKRLVEMHGGSISAYSEGKGHGAIFRVILPLLKPHPKARGQEDADRMLPAKFPLEILLVEDHGDTAQTTCALLEGMGHRVEIAGDVSEALRAATEREFDMLISDLGLPDRSGLDLMKELRRAGSNVVGIAVSGYGREEDVRRSKEAGFVEHLTKPVDFDTLQKTMSRVTV